MPREFVFESLQYRDSDDDKKIDTLFIKYSHELT